MIFFKKIIALLLLVTIPVESYAGDASPANRDGSDAGLSTTQDETRLASVEEIALFKKHYELLQEGDFRILKLTGVPEGKYLGIGDFLTAALLDLTRQFNWCDSSADDYQYSLDQEGANACIQQRYLDLIAQARKDQVIDVIEEANLNAFAPTLVYRIHLVGINISLYESPNLQAKHPKANEVALPELQTYLALKRYYDAQRAGKNQLKNFPEDLLKSMQKLYVRRITGVGRVDLIHYVMAKYAGAGRFQINTLDHMLTSRVADLVQGQSASIDIKDLSGKVIDELQIPYQSLSDILFCYLKYELKDANRENGMLTGFNPAMVDAAAASLITGSVSAPVFSTLMSQPEFYESKPNKGKIWKILDDVGKTLLLTQPQLVVYYTIASVLISSIKAKKEAENAAASDTDFINCR